MSRFAFLAFAVATLSIGAPTSSVFASDELAIVKTGSFEGRSNHITLGTVTLQSVNESWILVLEDDFAFDGAPDAKLAFGNGQFVPSTVFTPLKADAGIQDYMIPSHIDPSGYSQVWLWCEQYNVPLGVAEIAPPQ